VLYHYLQKELYEEDVWLFQGLVARLVVRLGVWISPSVYGRLPLLAPYARRDPGCRGRPKEGIPDQWGSPDERAYFRDDNSLVKGVPRTMRIKSSAPHYDRRCIGRGFVAAHVWRNIHDEDLASRNPLTFSFVPNLVWLPAHVAGLTDREGSFSQQYLQAVSHNIYRQAPVEAGHRKLVDRIWDLIPEPPNIPPQSLPKVDELNLFEADDKFFKRRATALDRVAMALLTGEPTGKVVSERYTRGIPSIPEAERKALGDFLTSYRKAVTLVE
jgi:hypothetical protein